jgi:AraC-like DNA-binding protein
LFHILVEGECWIECEGARTSLVAGDIALFPFDTFHSLGAGESGPLLAPGRDLPPQPWRALPTIRYDGEGRAARILCGYLACDAVNFAPLARALPAFIRHRTRGAPGASWLSTAIAQIVSEVEHPRPGGVSMLERLTEAAFIEVLRHRILAEGLAGKGWLAALANPALARALAILHADPGREVTLPGLAAAAGLSRSALAERFEATIGLSPIRYLREWRLYLASAELTSGEKPISRIAEEARYGTTAAFTRAFARTFGAPPAAWRAAARDEAPKPP